MRPPSQRNAVAKEIRAVLARAFPATQFSVRQSSRARSNRFIVTDGPSEDVATPNGRVRIAPHAIARAAVEALIDRGRAPASMRDEYVHASADAMMKVSPGPFPSVEALTAWVNAAANRWRIQPEPISIAELFPFIEKHGGRDD